jgi:hypothetical protein
MQKRRAQVREAQREYQKRKDTATAIGKHRADELLQLLSDLSTDVESLLQAAATAGNMQRNDEVSRSCQRLWSTYNTVVNSDAVKPEFQLLQLKNSRRVAAHLTTPNLPVDNASSAPQVDTGGNMPPSKSPNAFEPSAISFELLRFEGTTVMSTFQRTEATNRYMAGKSMFELSKERQAAMKDADRRAAMREFNGD